MPAQVSPGNVEKTEGGLFTDYARFSPSYEWASEFTWKIPCSGNGFIQPTLHSFSKQEHAI